MPGIPVVIAANGKGIPVKQVTSGAPVMTIATNGLGTPIVLTDRGAPFVVQGGDVPVDFNFQTFSMTAGGEGQWVGYSDGGSTRPQPAFGSINMQPTAVTNLLAFYDDTASGVMLAVFSGDYVDDMAGLQVSIGGYVISSFEVQLISGNTWVRFNGLPGDLTVGAMYEVLFGFALSPVYDADAQAYFNVMSPALSDDRKYLINEHVKSLKVSGVWPIMDQLRPLAQTGTANSRVNLRNPTGPLLTSFNGNVFVDDRGWMGDAVGAFMGTGHIFTDVNNFTQNAGIIGCYINATPAEANNNNPALGMDVTTGTLTFLRPKDPTGGMGGRVNAATNDNSGVVPSRTGFKALNRKDANTIQWYGPTGAPLGGALTKASAAMQTKELMLFRLGTGFGADRQAYMFIGGTLTDTQTQALYNSINTYLTAIGANVP